MPEIFTYTLKQDGLVASMQEVITAGRIIEDQLHVHHGDNVSEADLRKDGLHFTFYDSMAEAEIIESKLNVHIVEVVELTKKVIADNVTQWTTLLTVHQSVNSGSQFFVNSGGTYYNKQRDDGYLLESAQEFIDNPKIQITLNGNQLVKGMHVHWASPVSFTFGFKVDPGDFIKVLS